MLVQMKSFLALDKLPSIVLFMISTKINCKNGHNKKAIYNDFSTDSRLSINSKKKSNEEA